MWKHGNNGQVFFSISHCSPAFSTQIQNCNCLWVLVLLLLFILFLKYTDFHSIRFRQFSQIVEQSDGWCWSSHLIWKIGGPGVTRHKKANLGSWPYLYPHSVGKPQNLGSWRRGARKTLPQKRDLAKRWLALTYKTNLSRRSISISFWTKMPHQPRRSHKAFYVFPSDTRLWRN